MPDDVALKGQGGIVVQSQGLLHGYKDSIINYISDAGEKWTATIKDFVYFHYQNGDKSKGHHDDVIKYISGDNQGYTGSFAEWFDE
ncbi:MAG: DUF4751 family protein [Spirochaetaceae bacterium]|nr:DUF4751 family protein [Spirochaetaceae bacterium]